MADAAFLGPAFWLGEKAKHWLADPCRFSTLTGDIPAASDSHYLVKSHKLAAAAGLGRVHDTGHFITKRGDFCRDSIRDVGRPGLA
jgi:hypothetical protein